MIIVPTNIPLFQSNRSDLLNTVRYLQSNTTNSTNTTTNSTNSTTNSTNTTASTNTTTTTNTTSSNKTNITLNPTGWSMKFDSSITFISINPNRSNISSETCTSPYDFWVRCNGSTVQTPNMNRTDIIEYMVTQIPQPIQIKKAMDHLNRRAMIYGYMNISVLIILFYI